MKQRSIEDSFYKIGILLLFIALGFVITGRSVRLTPCLFHLLTGYYCPGCGGTRSVAALAQGKLFLSVYYHPLVPYGAAVYLAFMVTQTIGRILHKPKIGMKFRLFYVWVALFILFLNFAVKNALHYFYGFVM